MLIVVCGAFRKHTGCLLFFIYLFVVVLLLHITLFRFVVHIQTHEFQLLIELAHFPLPYRPHAAGASSCSSDL